MLALGLADDWLTLRLEIHPFLKVPLGSADRLSFRKLVQMHAILDKVDLDKERAAEEIREAARRR